MIVEDAIKLKLNQVKGKDRFFIRNALKEELQNFVLNFVYNSKYKDLIFTGGTCLRKSYGLNRLSEDLDFDYVKQLDIHQFMVDVSDYFSKKLQYKNLSVRLSSNKHSVFLKFPILKQLSVLTDSQSTPEDLFIRCDFSPESVGIYTTETNLVKAGRYEFLVLSYDLPTLFANKLVAFLERVYFKGKFQKVPLKGRDVYDLYWFLQVSAQTGFKLKPNKQRLFQMLGVDSWGQVSKLVKDKLNLIEPEYVYQDLYPLVESTQILEQFKTDYTSSILTKMDFALTD